MTLWSDGYTRAIAFLQLNSGMIAEPVLEHLDLYFRQCAILVTARALAVMAATLVKPSDLDSGRRRHGSVVLTGVIKV